jgi:hypothetical protein
MFRKFQDDGPEELDPEVEAMLAERPEMQRPRPLTRSSIRPRLLFPNEQQRHDREERDAKAAADANIAAEEEADTDIEDENVDLGSTVDEDSAYIKDTNPPIRNGKAAEDTPTDHLPPYKSAFPSTGAIVHLDQETASSAQPLPAARVLRSAAKRDVIPEESGQDGDSGRLAPFLAWKRTKSSNAASSSAAAAKGPNKRLSQEVEGTGTSAAKKVKGHGH